MGTTLLCIHGRDQESPPGVAGDDARLREHIGAVRRGWLTGLSRGLALAGSVPVRDEDVVFPFYADHFRRRIRGYEATGGRPPGLATRATGDAQERRLVEAKSAALIDAADALGFDPAREPGYPGGRAGPGRRDALPVPVLRAALRFLRRETGVATVVIDRFLTDVAYYRAFDGMRRAVLTIVEDSLRERSPAGGRVVVVGHGLGGIVACDLLTGLADDVDVRLLVTVGSPLGRPVDRRTFDPTRPISDHLADPDVSGPIGHAMHGG